MKKIEWRDELRVGIESIDTDHKKLVQLTNDLIDAVTHHRPKEDILTVYNELVDYTQYHFAREERFMTGNCDSYTPVDQQHHLKQHRYFINKLHRIKKELTHIENGSDPRLLDIVEFLVKWLLDHIIHQDLSLTSCIYNKQHQHKGFGAWINRRFSLFNRAKLVIILPLIFLLLTVGYISYDLYKRYRSLDKIDEVTQSIMLVYDVINELQIERGLSSAYLTSTNPRFKSMLQTQYLRTDHAVKLANDYKHIIDRYIDTHKGVAFLTKLPEIRKKVLAKRIERSDSNRYYTRFVRSLIDMIKSLNYLSLEGVQHNIYIPLLMLIEMNENTGLIRNEGTYLIEHGITNSDRFRKLYQQKLTYHKLFKRIADPNMLEQYISARHTKAVMRFENYLKPIIYTPGGKLPDAEVWFDVSSDYIAVFKELIETSLKQMHTEAHQEKMHALWVSSILWITLLLMLLFIAIISKTLKQSIVQPIEEITRALQRLAKGERSYFHTPFANDPIIRNMVHAFNTLRQSLIKAEYINTLIDLQTYKTKSYERLANLDALTGVPNKRTLNKAFRFHFNEAKDNNEPLSICILDIDHFKRINDTYGHEAGDKVLRRFAETMQSFVRKNDLLARYGGEEFVLLLPQTPFSDACDVAKKLKEATEAITFDDIAPHLRITVSIGIASTDEEEFVNPHHLFKLADARLYQAKKEGRNRIVPSNCR